jgi:hypothetical protein
MLMEILISVALTTESVGNSIYTEYKLTIRLQIPSNRSLKASPVIQDASASRLFLLGLLRGLLLGLFLLLLLGVRVPVPVLHRPVRRSVPVRRARGHDDDGPRARRQRAEHAVADGVERADGAAHEQVADDGGAGADGGADDAAEAEAGADDDGAAAGVHMSASGTWWFGSGRGLPVPAAAAAALGHGGGDGNCGQEGDECELHVGDLRLNE